jgi:hypothetical protein
LTRGGALAHNRGRVCGRELRVKGLFEGGVAAQLFRARALKEFSSLSYTLQTTTESITVYNAAYRGYKISQALSLLAQRLDQAIDLLEAAAKSDQTPFSDDEAKLVLGGLQGFVEVHSDALDAVINKHGLFTMIPYVEGIRQALLNVEQDVNDFANDLVDRIPTQERDANELFGKLGVKLHEAIAKYEEPMLTAAATLFPDH